MCVRVGLSGDRVHLGPGVGEGSVLPPVFYTDGLCRAGRVRQKTQQQ